MTAIGPMCGLLSGGLSRLRLGGSLGCSALLCFSGRMLPSGGFGGGTLTGGRFSCRVLLRLRGVLLGRLFCSGLLSGGSLGRGPLSNLLGDFLLGRSALLCLLGRYLRRS